MASLEVLNPVAFTKVRKLRVAPRLSSLDNKRIGLYWNAKMGGEKALARIADHITKKYKGVEFKLIKSAVPGPKEKVKEAKTFDALIASTGD